MTTETVSSPLHVRASHSPAAHARAVLTQAWNGKLPVDPSAIATGLGLNVVYKSIFDGYQYSGHFTRESMEIAVNGGEPPVRQRFTLAHELGHFVLGHQNAPRDSAASFSSHAGSSIEREANQFAAELLMPSDAVAKAVRSGQFKSVDELAKAFGVSKVAMTYRVNNLGLLV